MKLFKSIRWRLQLWVAFLLTVVLSGFGLTAYQLHRTTRLTQIDEALEQRVSALARDIRMPPQLRERIRGLAPPFPDIGNVDTSNPTAQPGTLEFRPHPHPPLERTGPPGSGPGFPPPGEPRSPFPPRWEIQLSPHTSSLFDESLTNGFYYVVWSREGSLLKHASNAPPHLVRPTAATLGILTRTSAAHREAFYTGELGECVLVGVSILTDLNALRRFAGWLVAAGLAVLAVGLSGGWLIASRAIRPVEAISASAKRISAGNLAERIDVTDTDSELGRLAGVLNSTFHRLESAFARQTRFTADASHELRTPLAVIISEAQSTLARERTTAEYRETVETCLDTAQQMKRLTQSLLDLARLDSSPEGLHLQSVDLAQRVRAAIDLLRPLADPRALRIETELRPAPILADAGRIDQVVTNLLSNAVHYNRHEGAIKVSTRLEEDKAVLTITDTGPGIAAEHLPHLFEPFFRADVSRSASEGHVGLGLAIVKAILEAHGGTIDVASQPGHGTTFVTRIPAEPS